VIDGNITSRHDDLAAFCSAIVEQFAQPQCTAGVA
jgi:hypothetical protein